MNKRTFALRKFNTISTSLQSFESENEIEINKLEQVLAWFEGKGIKKGAPETLIEENCFKKKASLLS